MKLLFFLSLLMGLVSCSSVKYYGYYYNDKNCPDLACSYAYCTLEVRKDKAIYRASTNDYIYQKKEHISFLYIETEKMEDWHYISLGNFSKLYYYFYDYDEIEKKFTIRKREKIAYNIFEGYEGFNSKKNGLSDNDKKQMGGFSKKNNIYKRASKLSEEYHFDDYDLDRIAIWFPSELKRVRKIDYSKFPKDLREKINLENPDIEKNAMKK